MAKKRKASGPVEKSKGLNLDVGDSTKRIRDYEDVAGSDDEFHLNRDKVLLDEGPDAKRRRRLQEEEEFLEPSDKEVLDYSGEEDEEDVAYENDASTNTGVGDGLDESDDEAERVEDDEEGVSWGMARGEIYGADAIETEEQALEEEAEALRLQKKQLQLMSAADYGFDEADWQDSKDDEAAEADDRNVVTEVLPQLQISDNLGPAERLKLLKSRYPEVEYFGKELLSMWKIQAKLVKDASGNEADMPNAITKLRAASAYVGALTMYFALLSSPALSEQENAVAISATQLHDHPVMDTLSRCKDLWARAEKLPVDPNPRTVVAHSTPLSDGVNGHALPITRPTAVRASPKKSRAQKHAEAAQAAAEARRSERMQRTEADLANLDSLMTRKPSKPKRNRQVDNDADSGIGEEAPLNSRDAAEKAKRKKSLRFYTSQIAQKTNKRGAAGRNAGGDEDIPYRERLKDRQARLNAEAEKRGRRTVDAGADLGGASDEEDARQAQAIRREGDDYYEAIAAKTAKKKADKAAFAEAQRQAALQGGRVIEEATVGPDGRRKTTYAIEKNKGLTPHRKKESRNPRVKKRKKFDEKKKKLGSIKPVYKGGEGRGGYGGELTGIKKGLVKSTKL
jgi:U3 small nucleolar RNA-associated protein 3